MFFIEEKFNISEVGWPGTKQTIAQTKAERVKLSPASIQPTMSEGSECPEDQPPKAQASKTS